MGGKYERAATPRVETSTLRAVLASFGDLYFRISGDCTFLDCQAPADRLHVPPDEFLGRHVRDVLPAPLAARIVAAIGQALTTGTTVALAYDLEAGGSVRSFDARIAPVESLSEVVVVVRDGAPVRPEHGARHLERAVELASEGIWTLDAAGTTTFANAAMAAMLGYVPADMVGAPISRFLATTARGVAALIDRRAGTGRRDVALTHRDGRTVHAEISSTPLRTADACDGVVALVSDITERRRVAADLAGARAQVQRIVAAVDEHIYSGEIGCDGRYAETYSGPGLDRLVGAADVSDVDWDALVHAEDRAAYLAFNRRLRAGERAQLEYRIVGLDGFERWVLDRAQPRARRPDGVVVIDGLVTDVTAQHDAAAELEQALVGANELAAALETAREAAELASRTDSLTGLANRRAFLAAVEDLVPASRRTSLGILMLDVDHFKHINDTFGHAVGDQVLIDTAQRLRRVLREGDLLARWGGEEFIVGLPVDCESSLDHVAQKLAVAIRDDDASGGIRVTASIGGALAGSRDIADIIGAADAALYAAKRRGRDRVVLETQITARDREAAEPDDLRLARALALLASVRTPARTAHAEQVAETAEMLAQALKLDATAVRDCVLAGWLHKIGMLALPDSTLRAAEAGDPAAAARARAHALVGAHLVSEIPTLARIAGAIRHQHEHFDGTGTPNGLAGDEIPISARVLAVATAYIERLAVSPDGADTPLAALTAITEVAESRLDSTVVAALAGAVGAT